MAGKATGIPCKARYLCAVRASASPFRRVPVAPQSGNAQPQSMRWERQGHARQTTMCGALPKSAVEESVLGGSNLVYTLSEQMNPETASAISNVLGPVFSVATLLMILRIVTTWYPETDETKLPWSIVYLPTEWILKPTRKVVPPSFGVDISPIVWVAIISFLNEILLGPQGILNLIIREQLAG